MSVTIVVTLHSVDYFLSDCFLTCLYFLRLASLSHVGKLILGQVERC